jgi:His/Glu/Gln/Arg/opine family amino acid ABC transporter permease subunit
MEFNTGVLAQHWPLLLQGLQLTVAATLVALAIGVAGGAVLCATGRSRRPWAVRLARAYVHFFRVTPEMILIFWGYFCAPLLLGLQLSGFWTGSGTLGLVAAAYLAEIFRAGIQAVPKGQWEAARALGLRFTPLWGRIVLPQALRLMVPPFVNYFTELVKNTTLLSAIGVGELALQAYLLGGQTFRYVEFLTAIAIGYFLVIFPASLLARRLERRARAA